MLKVSIVLKRRDAALFMTIMTNIQEKCRVWERLASNGAVVAGGERGKASPGHLENVTGAGMTNSRWVPHSLLGDSASSSPPQPPEQGRDYVGKIILLQSNP